MQFKCSVKDFPAILGIGVVSFVLVIGVDNSSFVPSCQIMDYERKGYVRDGSKPLKCQLLVTLAKLAGNQSKNLEMDRIYSLKNAPHE